MVFVIIQSIYILPFFPRKCSDWLVIQINALSQYLNPGSAVYLNPGYSNWVAIYLVITCIMGFAQKEEESDFKKIFETLSRKNQNIDSEKKRTWTGQSLLG